VSVTVSTPSWRSSVVRRRGVRAALAVVAGLLIAGEAAARGLAGDDPDALYERRDDLAMAERAADLWATQLAANPRDFATACKLARARHWLGEVSPRERRASHLERGIAAARVAIALEPDRADGYFWLGANMGALAGVSSVFTALKYRSAIRKAFETALARDATFAKGGAYCALGKYYNSVPAIFGGSKAKSEALLRRCLASDPGSTAGHYYLAQTLLALDRPAEARQALGAAVDGPCDPAYVPECLVWKRRSQRLLHRLEGTAK
jgi:tetratricopeptide (TPR) repeat protein